MSYADGALAAPERAGESGIGCVNMAARGGRGGGAGRGGMGGGTGVAGSGCLSHDGRGGIGGASPRLLKLFGASANLFSWLLSNHSSMHLSCHGSSLLQLALR